MNQNQAFTKLKESLSDLEKRKGPLTLSMLEAEVINLSCLEILKNNQRHNAIEITQLFANAAGFMFQDYGHAQATHATLGVPMNIQWDGMWEFLKNYFLSNHGYNIDDEDSSTIIFYSARHIRYENNQEIANTPADRTIDLFFTEGGKIIVVNIHPTLSAKKGYLTESTTSKMVYTGSDPDYRFTIFIDEIGEISRFDLEITNRKLRIEYLDH